VARGESEGEDLVVRIFSYGLGTDPAVGRFLDRGPAFTPIPAVSGTFPNSPVFHLMNTVVLMQGHVFSCRGFSDRKEMRHTLTYSVLVVLFLPLARESGVRNPNQPACTARIKHGPACSLIEARISGPLWRLPQWTHADPFGSRPRVGLAACLPRASLRRHGDFVVGYLPPHHGDSYLAGVDYYRARPRDPPTCSFAL
jgi:hypothetical protein